MRNIHPSYCEAVNWLYAFIPSPKRKPWPIKKTPEERLQEYRQQIIRMKTFLRFLGNPQNQFKSVHIAGTSGKGSTAMIIGKILEGAFPRVGVHTNPYLQVPGEKFLVNNKMISPACFVRIVNKLKDKYEKFRQIHPKINLKHGEIQVALYNLYFAETRLDWGVIETGVGGRFDPTNILQPKLSIITNLGFDHVPKLGNTPAEIAWHKAGIIKPKTPVITAKTKGEILNIIRKEASKKRAQLFVPEIDFKWTPVSITNRGVVITVNGPYNTYKNIKVPLLGPFQAKNAGLAIAAVDILSHRHHFSVSAQSINNSLRDLKFPGRMEVVQKKPTVILDGAHNPQKMAALAKAMKKLYPNKRFILICGILKTKNASLSFNSLLPRAKRIITVKPQVIGKPAMGAKELADIIKTVGYNGKIDIRPDILKAVKTVLKEVSPEEIILITGSLYLVGQARAYWVDPKNILLNLAF